jgi:glucokinase
VGHTLAVDLGGTNMRVAVVTREGTVLDRAQQPTPHHAVSVEPFVAFVRAMRDAHDVEHAVVAVPGRLDYQTGRLLDGPHLPADWPPVLTRDALADGLELPVVLANDADAAAIGEARFGAGRGHDDVVYVTISTGVGAGIIVGGRLLRPRYSAGEVGRSVVDRILARAGEDGTVEGLGSGTALARAALAAGVDAAGPDLVRLVEAGDPLARPVWDEGLFADAVGVVNLAHLVAPTVFVIGGGVGRNGELVLAPLRAALAQLGPVGPPIAVVPAALGDDSGLLGAAGWRDAT